VITGVTADQGELFATPLLDKMDQLTNNFTVLISKALFGKKIDQISDDDEVKAEVIKRFYMGNRNFSTEDTQALVDLIGDIIFISSMNKGVEISAATQRSPVFLYHFSHKLSGLDKFVGVTMHDHLNMLFDNYQGAEGAVASEEDEQTKDKLLTMIANFANYQDPTPYTDGKTEAIWEAFDPRADKAFLEITAEPEVKKGGLTPARTLFWDRMFWDDVENSQNLESIVPGVPAVPVAGAISPVAHAAEPIPASPTAYV